MTPTHFHIRKREKISSVLSPSHSVSCARKSGSIVKLAIKSSFVVRREVSRKERRRRKSPGWSSIRKPRRKIRASNAVEIRTEEECAIVVVVVGEKPRLLLRRTFLLPESKKEGAFEKGKKEVLWRRIAHARKCPDTTPWVKERQRERKKPFLPHSLGSAAMTTMTVCLWIQWTHSWWWWRRRRRPGRKRALRQRRGGAPPRRRSSSFSSSEALVAHGARNVVPTKHIFRALCL